MCGLLIGLGKPDLLLRGFRAPDVVAVAGVEGAGLIGVMVAPLCFTPPAVAVVLPVNLCVATIGATADLVAVLPAAFGLNNSRLLTPECCCDLGIFFAVDVVPAAAAVAATVLVGVANLDGVAGRNDLRLGVLGKSDLLFGVASGLLAGVAGKGVAAVVCFFAGGRRDLLLFRLTGPFAAAAVAAGGGGHCFCWLFATPSGLLPAAGLEPVALDSDWR